MDKKIVWFLKNPGTQASLRSSRRSQCPCGMFVGRACICSQITPLSAPMRSPLHSTGSGSSNKPTTTAAYHVCQNRHQRGRPKLPNPLLQFRVKFLQEPQIENLPSCWGLHSPLNLFPNQCVISDTVSIGKSHSISDTRQSPARLPCASSSSSGSLK